MRLYVGGPMSGLPHNNHPAFAYACRRLYLAGHTPVSPHTLEANVYMQLQKGMTRGELYCAVIPGDIVALASCQGMIVLPGFESSDGTAFELHGAELFQLEVFRPAFTSDEFPGGLAEWVDVIIDMVNEYVNTHAELTKIIIKEPG